MAEDEQLIEIRVSQENRTHNTDTNSNTTKNALCDAVLNNEIDVIPHLIEMSTINSIYQRYSDYGNKTILIIACTNEQVSKNTLETLCVCMKSRYSSINSIDEYWYRWEPIHYVAKMADPEKLKVILDNIGGINSLTVFSENALHVLLEYEKSVKPINALLYHGPESRDCTIIGTERANIIQCAKILIDAGIDVNHGNFWNETPICLAARYRYRETVKILLNTAYVDLDNYDEGRMKIREYLKKKLLQSTLTHSTFLHGHEDPVKILFNFLKSENEEAFIQFNNENIKDYANSFDGNNERSTSGNMLQLCFRKGFFEYLQHDLYNEELTDDSIMNSPMLTVFCAKGLGRCIEHLLNNGANPKITYPNKFPENLLEAAAVRGYYPLVALLLQHKGSSFTPEDIFEILPKLFKEKHQLNNYKFYRKHVLCLLLNKLHVKGGETLSSKKLNILNNVLCHLNVERDDDKEEDSENICQILKLGASLTNKINSNEMVIQRLHPEILKMHLDDCIENNLFYYNSIIEDSEKSYSEIKALRFLIYDKKKIGMLTHPLLIHFIHNKWLRIFYFFYIDLLLYTGFLISLYAYMISVNIQYSNKLINIIFYIFLILHIAKEGVQLVYLYRLKYFLDASNYLELCVIVASIVTIFCKNIYSMVIAILFSTTIFTLFLGQLPICAKFTIIFGSTKYFLQYAGFYLMQFFSFALVFHIIFPFETKTQGKTNSGENTNISSATDDPVGSIFKSMFYTLIMFTGEFNDRVLEPEMYPAFGRIIMTVFIFCMTIILNNLLVGLIVADMDEMQRESKLYKQVRIANFIIKANSFVKRLHDFKAHRNIKNIINFFHIFKKEKNKIIDISACSHPNVFDEEDKQHLRDIKNKKFIAYKADTLRELYEFLQYEKEHRKDIKKIRDISKQLKLTHLEE